MSNHIMTYPGPAWMRFVLGVPFYRNAPQIVQGIRLVRACQRLLFTDVISGSSEQIYPPLTGLRTLTNGQPRTLTTAQQRTTTS